ncbi:MAG: S8 family serine peptidase, partial [Okeania sp. SIO3C4]|nr:S8 family serine peptidase [Okeania sp. SIO3C4]
IFDIYKDEDPNFGKYNNDAKELDELLYNNSHLLSVWAAGNDRNETYTDTQKPYYLAFFSGDSKAPESAKKTEHLTEDEQYWYVIFNKSVNSNPPADGSKAKGYDILPPHQNAKNTLVVGAINDTKQIASFSSWGATDDGRIKPDVVGNGVNVYSTDKDHDADYDYMSGTSMAAPNVTGTAALLHQHYTNLYGSDTKPSSATMKGLLIHTAVDQINDNDKDENDPDYDEKGPDYIYGWGLVDGAAAANFLTNSKAEDGSLLRPDQSYTGTAQTIEVKSDGSGPVKVSMVWTDIAGTANENGLDDDASALVNDLDLSIVGPDGKTHYPWTLDPADPTLPAKQDKKNSVDNVEQVLIENPAAGTYTIHVGSDDSFSQKYSLFASGLGNEEITVTSPNGGEIGKVGEELNITWEDNVSGNVKLDLYQGDVLVAPIVEATETDQSYSWTIPDSIAAGNNYQVKITSADGTISDLSDSNFSIELADNITVTSPNGGESGKVGEALNITWEDNVSGNVKLDLYQGDVLVSPIVEATETDQSYSWTIPDSIAAGNNYQVKITNADGTVSDFSDGNFSIEELTEYINFTSLNGGETLVAGEEYSITWDSNITGDVKIEVYQGGLLSHTIGGAVAGSFYLGTEENRSVSYGNPAIENDGSFSWSLPRSFFVEGDNYQLKISSLSDDSIYNFSENFSIDSEKYLTISSPNGSEVLEPGKNYTITWDDENIIAEDVKIDLYKGGVLDRTIAEIDAVANSAEITSYDWKVPEDITSGDDYQIQIRQNFNLISMFPSEYFDSSEKSVIEGLFTYNYDKSDNYFSIEPKKYITLTSPNAGETLVGDENYPITWDSNITGDVKIEVYQGGMLSETVNGAVLGSVTIGSDTIETNPAIENNGSISWRVFDWLLAGGDDYQLKISSLTDDSIYDFSENFSIDTETYLNLDLLNGGQALEPGKDYIISWDDNIEDGDVKIDLYKGGVFDQAIVEIDAADLVGITEYKWEVPTDIVSGDDYEIQIRQNVNYVDYFSYEDFDESEKSALEGLVRYNYDKSDSYFSIEPLEYIELTSINNGETLKAGETYEITWDSNITGNVRIDLYEGDSPYNFLDYNTIVALHKAADAQQIADELGLDDYDESLIGGGLAEDGSYTWTVPEDFLAGDEYEFKITSIGDDTVEDFSDSKFSVVAAEDYIDVTSFNVGDGLIPGETYEITWESSISGSSLLGGLYKGDSPYSYYNPSLYDLAAGNVTGRLNPQNMISGVGDEEGSYDFTITNEDGLLVQGDDYRILLTILTGEFEYREDGVRIFDGASVFTDYFSIIV